MVKRFRFFKNATGNSASCWYCDAKTNFALADKKDGSEVWCCPECGFKYGKIKRLRNLLRKYPHQRRTSKKQEILCVKKSKNSSQERGGAKNE